jgi:hypothetical protein
MERYAGQYRCKLFHYGPPDKFDRRRFVTRGEQEYARLVAPLRDYVDPHEQAFIVDRFHWGVPVYGNQFRPQHSLHSFGELGPRLFYDVEDLIESLGGVTVWVDTPPEICTSRLEGVADEFLDEEGVQNRRVVLQSLYNGYERLAPMCPTWRGRIYDRCAGDVERMERRIAKLEARCRHDVYGTRVTA